MKMSDNTSVSLIHSERLASFERMWNSGVAVGVVAALDYCVEYNVHQPPWLTKAARDLLCDAVVKHKSTRRGRASGYLARFRQDMIDYARWNAVVWARENQQEVRRQVDVMRSFSDVPLNYSQDRGKLLGWLGSTLERAYECAAMTLEGTSAYAGPDAIKKSYFTVQRNLRSPRTAYRYHVLDYPLLKRLGLEPPYVVRPGKPVVPLYELTL
jgi:hypothetical protein